MKDAARGVYAATLIEALTRVNKEQARLIEMSSVVPSLLEKSPELKASFEDMFKIVGGFNPDKESEGRAYCYGWLLGVLVGHHMLGDRKA